MRDLLHQRELNEEQKKILDKIENLLFEYDLETGKDNVRLELQYPESKDYLNKLIDNVDFFGEITPSIARMEEAYSTIKDFYAIKINNSIEKTINHIRYFLTKVEIVKIVSENLSSALKIFETINQRGMGLNAMDLIIFYLVIQMNLILNKLKRFGRK